MDGRAAHSVRLDQVRPLTSESIGCSKLKLKLKLKLEPDDQPVVAQMPVAMANDEGLTSGTESADQPVVEQPVAMANEEGLKAGTESEDQPVVEQPVAMGERL